MNKTEQGRLRFRGAPTRVMATLAFDEELPPAQDCCVSLPGTGSLPLAVRALRSSPPIISTLSFRLPRSTPPGSYKGNMQLGARRVPIAVDVESRSSLRFVRARITHKGIPGARVSTELTLLNRGNVHVTIPDEDSFCVFDNGGVARALYRGLVEKASDSKQRIDRILDELAKAHGGLVRVAVISGAGRLAPGEVRDLKVELHFSRRLTRGNTYGGTWSVSGASLEVEIDVIKYPVASGGFRGQQ